MRIRFCILCLLFVVYTENILGQTMELSLGQTIEIAQKSSFDMFRAKNMYLTKELDYQDFLTELKPHLNLQLTPINYNRSIVEEYNSELMKYQPVEIQRLTSQYNLGINQPIKLTGGNLNVYSSLMRSQRFGGTVGKDLDFISTPISATYRQNFSQINTYKWTSKIEPLKFEQAKLEYVEQREEVSITAVNLFFTLLSSQMNLDIAILNQKNAETLLGIGKKRERIGAISRDDLLNLELKQVNASMAVDQARNTMENARMDLCEFLELPENTAIKCMAPEKVALTFIDPSLVQQLAIKNNPDSHILIQKLAEVQKQLSAAKQSRYDISLEVGVGLNQNKGEIAEAFQDLLDRQNFKIGLNIPIFDWKETKRRIEKAFLSEEITLRENEKIKDRLLIDVTKKANEFNLKLNELNFAAKADTISQSAYEATQELFTQGKVSVININESYKAMYSAKNQYLSALRNYWFYYYAIRKLCLYDFETDMELTDQFDQILENQF